MLITEFTEEKRIKSFVFEYLEKNLEQCGSSKEDLDCKGRYILWNLLNLFLFGKVWFLVNKKACRLYNLYDKSKETMDIISGQK